VCRGKNVSVWGLADKKGDGRKIKRLEEQKKRGKRLRRLHGRVIHKDWGPNVLEGSIDKAVRGREKRAKKQKRKDLIYTHESNVKTSNNTSGEKRGGVGSEIAMNTQNKKRGITWRKLGKRKFSKSFAGKRR